MREPKNSSISSVVVGSMGYLAMKGLNLEGYPSSVRLLSPWTWRDFTKALTASLVEMDNDVDPGDLPVIELCGERPNADPVSPETEEPPLNYFFKLQSGEIVRLG